MISSKTFSLQEIRECLYSNKFPFSGTTELGSVTFRFAGPAPYLGVAIHAGSRVRDDMLEIMHISEDDRYREEDPHTERFIKNLPIRITALDSRYEYDLNREPEKSVYSSVRGIWGVKVWKRKVNEQERIISLAKHREFHDLIDMITGYLLQEYNSVLLFDMHSYCYQREKQQEWFMDPRPEINLGTEAVNRKLFGPLIDQFIHELSKLRIDGHPVRVAENEIFPGGYLSRRLSKAHHDRVLVLALEYKKLFMDEWAGSLYQDKLALLVEDFERSVKQLLSSVDR